MKKGTKSVLFGVHQFILHPIFVLWAWMIYYRSIPNLAEFCAIVTHDLGYWGSDNMDDDYGEQHPQRVANWWRFRFGSFGWEVAKIVLGHSKHFCDAAGLPVGKLYRPDKLASALYPVWLYWLLSRASGEIDEYMYHADFGKYSNMTWKARSRCDWIREMQGRMIKLAYHGPNYYDRTAEESEGRGRSS